MRKDIDGFKKLYFIYKQLNRTKFHREWCGNIKHKLKTRNYSMECFIKYECLYDTFIYFHYTPTHYPHGRSSALSYLHQYRCSHR